MVCNAPYIPSSCSQKACTLLCRRVLKKNRSIKYVRENPEHFKALTKKNYRKRKQNNNVVYVRAAAKQRAKLKGLDFNLSCSDIIVPAVCPVLKTKFIYNTEYALSLDRIDPNKGYVKDNVQALSLKANIMKNNATPEELLKFADWVYATYR